MPTSPLALLGLGFALGLRHALDVDHLAAVSTIVSQRAGVWRSSLVGALWGLGHTASLLAVAVVVIALHASIPASVGLALELGVAAMLVWLGASLLLRLWRGATLHVHVHDHGGRPHAHPHVHAPSAELDHAHHPRTATRPLLVGMVHGLAGSGALMLAVLASIERPAIALGYVTAFGMGAVGGMVAMSTLLGLPLAWAAQRYRTVETALRASAAVASVAVGLWLAWDIGVEAGVLA
jgi:hypothetical protein